LDFRQKMSDPDPNSIIEGYKRNKNPSARFRIPIRDSTGLPLGTLVCVDASVAEDAKILEDLTSWRSRYMRYFLTQFEASIDRTAAWLKLLVLPDRKRLLFMIHTESDEAIGNFALCNINAQSAELDNLIRGRKGGHAQLIFFAEIAMLSWMFNVLKMRSANLHVFSNNMKTISLHTSVGFSTTRQYGLSKIEEDGETRYIVDGTEGEPVAFQYNLMSLERASFYGIFPWACAPA